MFYKTIIQGPLTFNNEKSYAKVVKMYEYRTETYYKNDVLLNQEDIFNAEAMTLTVPRFVGNASDKSFRNTVSLLDYCSQFAVAGEINAWMIEEGKVLNYKNIQPESDKAVVMQFKKGDKLFQQGEDHEEALKAFNKTIEKYDSHAQAYERRGWTNMRLKNYSDAKYDFNKAIKLDDSIAFAYYGKAFIEKNEGNLEEAIKNFELTLKKSIALETLYWKARLKKAECHIDLKQWDKAAFDLKFFTKRAFKPGDSNLKKKAYSYVLYGMVLAEMEEYKEALAEVEKAFEIKDQTSKDFELHEAYYIRGLIKKGLNKRDAKRDFEMAIQEGSTKAKAYVKK